MPPKMRLTEEARRYSWPPFKLSLSGRKKDIEDDPFSYIMEPVMAHVSQPSVGIDAGIRSRSLSPRMTLNKDKVLQSPTINRLKRWIQRMEVRYLHNNRTMLSDILQLPSPPRTPSPSAGSKRPASIEEDPEPMFDIMDITIVPSQHIVRRPRSSRRRYGNKMVRSHSKKARVWREPDDGLWSVLEEPEDIGLGIKM